jgi:hypothetical protein
MANLKAFLGYLGYQVHMGRGYGEDGRMHHV